MVKRIFAGLFLVFAVFTAQAGVITISDYYLNWISGKIETGGVGIMSYRESNNALKQFEVNIAPFAQNLNAVPHETYTPMAGSNYTWLTPVAGSGYTFDPVGLSGAWAENIIFVTSMGLGFATWTNGELERINFPAGYASWTITKIDTQVSTVPEPGTLALLFVGMIGALPVRWKQKKVV